MHWDWHAAIALVLAIGAIVALIILAISELSDSGHIPETEAVIFSTTLGAIVGTVAVYLGGKDKGE